MSSGRYGTLANPKIEVGTCERKQCKRNSMDEKFFTKFEF